MKAKKIASGLLILPVLLASGCSVWQRIEKPAFTDSRQGFETEVPVGWVQRSLGRDAVLFTEDGPGLQSIIVERRSLSKAFPNLEEKAETGMSPRELADKFIADLKVRNSLDNVDIRDLRPARVDGRDGFLAEYQFRNTSGLRYRERVYGVAVPSGMYVLLYSAPVLHYYDDTVDEFERVVENFTFTD